MLVPPSMVLIVAAGMGLFYALAYALVRWADRRRCERLDRERPSPLKVVHLSERRRTVRSSGLVVGRDEGRVDVSVRQVQDRLPE